MRRGIAGIELAPDAAAAPPASGVYLGNGHGGPVRLRLFRLPGTSAVSVSALACSQLIAVRAAAAGTPVQVLTGRPDTWQGLTFDSQVLRIYAATDLPPPPDGPSLLVDDRPPQARRAVATAPWQCRLDVRTEWSRQEIASFAHANLTVFGILPADLTAVVASAYRIPQHAAAGLAHLEPGVVGLARRGLLELVRLDPTQAESGALDPGNRAGGRPIWR